MLPWRKCDASANDCHCRTSREAAIVARKKHAILFQSARFIFYLRLGCGKIKQEANWSRQTVTAYMNILTVHVVNGLIIDRLGAFHQEQHDSTIVLFNIVLKSLYSLFFIGFQTNN